MTGSYTYLPLERVIFGRPAAEAPMKNLWVRTNPQPIGSTDDVMRLLEAAW